jgi:transmembrane sensor
MPRKSRRTHSPNDDQQWQQAWEQRDRMDADRKQDLLNSIHQRIDNTRRKKKQVFYIGLSAAAAIMVAVLIKMPWAQQELPVESWTELASNDSLHKVELEDGSVLWLAPHSTVRVYPDFKNKRNTVLTRGTVFFSVVKDAEHPFAISVNKQQVTVLGTQFTINRLDSTDLQLTVKEGKVALDNAGGRNVLTAGQQVLTHAGKTSPIQTIDPVIADWWARTDVRLHNISLGTLLRCIETYYGITLTHDRIDPDLKVSLTWDMTISLNENLKVVNALTGYNIH